MNISKNFSISDLIALEKRIQTQIDNLEFMQGRGISINNNKLEDLRVKRDKIGEKIEYMISSI
jgi:hypothetical protein